MRKVFDFLYKINEVICKLLLVLLVLVVAYVVFGRFVLSRTPAWGEELGLMAMIWIALLSASLAVHDESHLKLALLDLVLPGRIIRLIDRGHMILTMIFGVLLVKEGLALAAIGRLNRLPGLRISSFWFYIIVPIAGFVLIVHCIERLFRTTLPHRLGDELSGDKI